MSYYNVWSRIKKVMYLLIETIIIYFVTSKIFCRKYFCLENVFTTIWQTCIVSTEANIVTGHPASQIQKKVPKIGMVLGIPKTFCCSLTWFCLYPLWVFGPRLPDNLFLGTYQNATHHYPKIKPAWNAAHFSREGLSF